MTRNIAIFGGSFNPPGQHHRAIAEMLAQHFDEVIVVPCGPRPDKPTTDDVPPIYRACMADMTFRCIDGVQVDLFDLEASTFTRTYELQQRYGERGRLWHVIGGDLLDGGAQGQSVVHREWAQGEEIWRDFDFAVVKRPGYHFDSHNVPPNSRVFDNEIGGSSTEIRHEIFHHRRIDGLVRSEVQAYIERHNLYRGMRPPSTTVLRLDAVRPLVIADPRNREARKLAQKWPEPAPAEPNLIIVIGGDGTMLRAIRSEWRRRVPFYGINAGHMGFLLNSTEPTAHLGKELVLEHLPLLWTEVERIDGNKHHELAFNDAWVERATGQTAWVQVTINGRRRLPELVADGVLVATAAGSTSYARAMGASALPLNTPSMLLVGSNVLRPSFFQPAVLHHDARVELLGLQPEKRPLRGYIDGVDQGMVRRLLARTSNIATVELAFDPQYDAAEKLARIQFPLTGEVHETPPAS